VASRAPSTAVEIAGEYALLHGTAPPRGFSGLGASPFAVFPVLLDGRPAFEPPSQAPARFAAAQRPATRKRALLDDSRDLEARLALGGRQSASRVEPMNISMRSSS
jgi:hypothetical protein